MKYLLFLFPIFLQAQCLIPTHSYRLICADEVRYADSIASGSRLYISSRNAFVTSPRSVFSLVNGYGQHFIQITNSANSQKVAINRAWINRIDSTSGNKALIYIKDISVTFTTTESYTAVKDSAIACFIRSVASGLATLSDGDYGDVVVSGGGLVMTVDKPDLGLHNLADGDFSVVADSTALSLTNTRAITLQTKNIDGWISRYLQTNNSLTLRTNSTTKTSRIFVDTTGANFQFVNGANNASLRIGDSVAVRFNTSGSVGQVLTVTSVDGDGRLVINPKTGGSGTANCEQTLTKNSHGFSKWTPIYYDGEWKRPTFDSIIPTYIVVDSTSANTFKVSNCGNYSSTLTAGLYYYTGTSPGYSLTPTSIPTPIFEVAQARLILQPLIGFQLAGGSGSGDVTSAVLADTAAAIRADLLTNYYDNYRLPAIYKLIPANGLAANESVANYGFASVNSTFYKFSTTPLGTPSTEYGGWAANGTSGDSIAVDAPCAVAVGNSLIESHGSGLHGRLHPGGVATFNRTTQDVYGHLTFTLRELTNMRWFNHGIGGQTTNQIFNRWRRDVLAETYDPGDGRGSKTLNRKPTIVLVEGGINDVYSLPLNTTKINLEFFARSARDNGILAVFLNCPGDEVISESVSKRIDSLNTWMNSGVLQAYGASVVDFNNWWKDATYNDNSHGNSFLVDDIHPSSVGYDSLARFIFRSAKLPVLTGIKFTNKLSPDGFSGYSRPASINIQGVQHTITSEEDTVTLTAKLAWDSVYIKINSSTSVTGTSYSGFSHIEWVFENDTIGVVTKKPILYQSYNKDAWRTSGNDGSTSSEYLGTNGAVDLTLKTNSTTNTIFKSAGGITHSFGTNLLETNIADINAFGGDYKAILRGTGTTADGYGALFEFNNYGYSYLRSSTNGFTDESRLYLEASRGTIASPSTKLAGDRVGGFYFRAYSPTGWKKTAAIINDIQAQNGNFFYNIIKFGVSATADDPEIGVSQLLWLASGGHSSHGSRSGKAIVRGDFVVMGTVGDTAVWMRYDDKNFFKRGVGVGIPHTGTVNALLQIGAGTATANTAPLKFTSGTNLTTAEAGAIEYDGTEFYATNSTASRTTLARVLKGSATLDFGSTAANSVTTLTITVTGAADGDVVSLGIPNGSQTTTGIFTAWVSAANTVSVKFYNGNILSAEDPASGTFKVTVTK